MTPAQFTLAFFLGAALIFIIYALLTSRGKGPLLSSNYLRATKEERKRMDKRAEYRKLTVMNLVAAAILAAVGLCCYFGAAPA